MNIFVGELVGTMVLILLGEGVVANVVLNKSKGKDSGWIVITAGWGFAVAMAVYIAGWTSGAHINPAVTIALASVGDIPAAQVPVYLAGQFIGAAIGALLVWLTYFAHWSVTDDADAKLAVFATAPAIRNTPANLMTEIIGTAVLILGVMGISNVNNGLGDGMSPFLVGILVFSIGLSLGGPTGYAINPARDLAPRIMHAIMPIPGRRDSDWGYAWVPVVGPIIGGVIAALFYTHFFAGLTPL
ncbi:MAG: MIP/aquaporin family protein [Planctomycetota bacterium]|nr:MIP/aquaporin family protein [Planctomycetota bacterium]